MMGDPYEDRPASHATHHTTGEGEPCWCQGKTEAASYAAFAFVIPVLVLALIFAWVAS